MKKRANHLEISPETVKRANDFCESLAPRQGEQVDYMAMGYSNARIAREMGLRPKTVKNNIRIIFRKLAPTADEDPRAAAVMLRYVYRITNRRG